MNWHVFKRHETHSGVLVSVSTCHFKNYYYLSNCVQPCILLTLSPVSPICGTPIYTIEWEGEMKLFLSL